MRSTNSRSRSRRKSPELSFTSESLFEDSTPPGVSDLYRDTCPSVLLTHERSEKSGNKCCMVVMLVGLCLVVIAVVLWQVWIARNTEAGSSATVPEMVTSQTSDTSPGLCKVTTPQDGPMPCKDCEYKGVLHRIRMKMNQTDIDKLTSLWHTERRSVFFQQIVYYDITVNPNEKGSFFPSFFMTSHHQFVFAVFNVTPTGDGFEVSCTNSTQGQEMTADERKYISELELRMANLVATEVTAKRLPFGPFRLRVKRPVEDKPTFEFTVTLRPEYNNGNKVIFTLKHPELYRFFEIQLHANIPYSEASILYVFKENKASESLPDIRYRVSCRRVN